MRTVTGIDLKPTMQARRRREFVRFRRVFLCLIKRHHGDLQARVERSGKRLPGHDDRFSESSDRSGSEVADESAISARYEVAGLRGRDHRRSLLMPTQKRVDAVSSGTLRSRIGA